MVDYSISSQRTLYLPGRPVTIPANIKHLKTNCIISRLMSILFSFQSRNFIKQTLKNHIFVLFLPVTLKIY